MQKQRPQDNRAPKSNDQFAESPYPSKVTWLDDALLQEPEYLH